MRNRELLAVREWKYGVPELLDFMAEVNAAVICAKSPSARCIAGLHCDKSFCDGRVKCEAYAAMKLAGTGFEDVDITSLSPAVLPEPSTLTMERLSQIVAALGNLSAWMNACQEYLEALLMQGIEVPGWKVVEKIGRAKWIADEQQVAGELELFFGLDENLIRPRKLTTITEVKTLMKGAGAKKSDIDDFLLKHTIKESSGLTIAQESDRRPAVNAAERAFGDVQT